MARLIVMSLLLVIFAAAAVNAQTNNFQHVIVIVQENRTPDNLFQGLCVSPFGSDSVCSTTPGPGQYNIQKGNWLTKGGNTITPGSVPLANNYDLSHTHIAFLQMCDKNSDNVCQMDGAAAISCNSKTGCPTNPQFKFVSNAKGVLNSYLELATRYGWANYMFQTNQGPSFPAHQFLFGGTSAPGAAEDAAGIYASSNLSKFGTKGGDHVVGCTAPSGARVKEIMPDGHESTQIYPCFEHQTMADLFDAGPVSGPSNPISWRYYAPKAGSIWTAPNAIQHICQSSGPGGECTSEEWTSHVDVPESGGGGSVDIVLPHVKT